MKTYHSFLCLIASCVGQIYDYSNIGKGNILSKDINIRIQKDSDPLKKLEVGSELITNIIGTLNKTLAISNKLNDNEGYTNYKYNQYDGDQYKFEFDEGNPDIYEKIECPCEVYDTFCIRRFFAQHSKCKITGGPVPDPMFRAQGTANYPRVNIGAIQTNTEYRGLANARVEEFYINKATDNLLITPEFDSVSDNSYVKFYIRGRETVVARDFGGLIYAVSVIYPELEKQYTAEQWSKRFASPEEVVTNHIKVVTAASEEAVANIPHQLDIQYGSTLKTKLDIFGTDLPNDAPILVYIHGGYWQSMGREISRYPVHPLYRCGVKTVIIGYDLCPNVTLPQIVEEIYDAARYVFGYAENMGSRGVYFAGHSAGGQLVAKILSNEEFLESNPGSYRLQGAFLISGVFDLTELVYTSINDAIQLPVELAVPLSPLFDDYSHLQGSGIRIYIVAGENDSPRFKKQSREFYEVLQNTWRLENLYFKILDAVDHYSIVEWLAQDTNYLKNLLVHDIRKYGLF